MRLRFGAIAAAAAFCSVVLAWAAFPPDFTLKIPPREVSLRGGHAFVWPIVTPEYLPEALLAGDSMSDPKGSRLQLYEQGRPIGPAHALHLDIEQAGSGRFSHWLATVIFSASDNTDPRSNGRSYEARTPIAPPFYLVAAAGAVAAGLAGLLLVWSLSKLRLAATARALASGANATARRLPIALPFLLIGALLFVVALAWSLFPPDATWRIDPREITPRTGHAFVWTVPKPTLFPLAVVKSDGDSSRASRLRLTQDGKLLGPPRVAGALIADIGAGSYSHWNDTVEFASADNSDPRHNGRIYEARAPVVPSVWTIAAAAALFAMALVVNWRRRLRGDTSRDARWARVAGAMPAAALVAAALVATISLTGAFRGERIVSAAVLTPNTPQALLAPGERISRKGVYVLEFARFYAPFLEITCCAGVDIRRGETPILLDAGFDPRPDDPLRRADKIRLRPDNRFYDFEDYLYLHLDTPPRWDETLTLRFPVQAEPELIVILWLAALGALALRRRTTRFVLQPTGASLLRGTAAAAAFAATVLLAINTLGLVIPLRSSEIDRPSPTTVIRSNGPGDATMTWETARTQLAPAARESRLAYAHRLTRVIAESVMHYWYERDRRAFRLQIPVWENYVLWLAGELRPEYRLYAFADPEKAIERGVGMCDQVSSALVMLLRRAGLDARVVQLNGHTVVTAEVDPGVWHVLDADYNVVIPQSMAQIHAEPNMIRPYYQAAFKRLDPVSNRTSLDLIASFYAPPTYIGEAGDNSALGERRIAFEAQAYWLKWRLPMMLLAFAAVIFAGLRIAARRRSASMQAPAQSLRQLFRPKTKAP